MRREKIRWRARQLAGALVVSALMLAGCQTSPTRPAASSAGGIRGVVLADWTPRGYRRSSADRALQAIAGLGATHLAVVVTAYQSGLNASAIRADPRRTPAASAVRQVLEGARELGLQTALKPHVDLDDGAWRGHIVPADPEAWFASYREVFLPWAELAESVGGAQFVVGTELAGTLEHERLWRETIAGFRSVFSGELIYAASWDEAAMVPFWENLDLVGVDAYFPVATRRDPGRFELLAGWQPWLERLWLLHRQTGRRIVLTEIGYRSVDGAGMHPYAFGDRGVLDLTEQADLYWAALQATAAEPWLEGLYWWNWPAGGAGGPGNTDFTPGGKPAEIELARAWSGP